MTDPRYLVPLHLLPPVSGAPTAYLCTECGAAWVGSPLCCAYNPDSSTVVECLDLSAPPGDPPTRLDALGWALAVLGRRLGVRIGTTHDIVAMSGHDERTLWSAWSPGSVARILAADDPGWEEFDHTDRDQPRRIVAAALRNHVQKVSP